MEKEIILEKRVRRIIYLIRGQKVILDRDLAALYEVPTKALKQAVKRNPDRFPQDFMFVVTGKGTCNLEVTICDLKFLGRHPVSSDGFHRTGSGRCSARDRKLEEDRRERGIDIVPKYGTNVP